MNGVTVSAPAKINLMLDVTGRRSDGYHTLLTIMQSVSLADTVYITPNGSGRITVECDTDGVPCGSENIAYRAAQAFYPYTKKQCTGLHIKIVKHIPLQAGLGGGSADGAAVLTGLNELLGTGYSDEILCRIGATLGADVPFCIVGGTKICRGIGEEISYAPPLEDCFIVIAKGSGGISTKEAYGKIDSLAPRAAADISLYDGSVASVKRVGGNIFEEVTENGEVSAVKEILLQCGAEYTAMSGSGSAVFGLFGDKKNAEECCKVLKLDSFFSCVCTPMGKGARIL